jgi:inosine/xanthosine triphosphatase
MKTIIVGSENPVKAQAVLGGFQRMFPNEAINLTTVSVPSGVSSQPQSSGETLRGALKRARGVADLVQEADYWVGIEGGIEDTAEGMTVFAWVVVMSAELMGKGRTGTFFLPERVARLVREGKELGEADDIVFGRENSKQEEGAIGILTRKVMDRAGLYEHAVILALVPFKNVDIY